MFTYTQPPVEEGPITSVPYDPVVPASSECTQFASAELFAAAASWWNENVSSVETGTTTGATGTGATRTNSGASATATDGDDESSSAILAARSMFTQSGNGAGAGAAIAFMGVLVAAVIIV